GLRSSNCVPPCVAGIGASRDRAASLPHVVVSTVRHARQGPRPSPLSRRTQCTGLPVVAGHVAGGVPGTPRPGGILLTKMATQMPSTPKYLQAAKQTGLSRPLARRTAARWWLVAPTLFLLVVVNQLDKTKIAVLIADQRFLLELGLVGQHARIGLLSTIFFFGCGFGLLAWGFVVDGLGPRRSAAIGVCGWA